MALLDQYGRPVSTAALTTPLASPGLTGIRSVWTDSVASGLTPHRLATILRACDMGDIDAFMTLAEEMEERDPHYFSVLGMRKRAVSGVRPTVTPGADDARGREIAEAVRGEIAEHSGFSDMVEDLLDALGKGFSVVEIDWKKSAKLWTPRGYSWRSQRFFLPDAASGDEIRLRDAADPAHGIPLAPFKFIVQRTRLKSGLAFRGSLARVVAFGWMCKAYTFKDWMAFIETYGLPLRLGRYGAQHSPADIQKLFQAVANIGTDAAAVVPEGMNIEFIATATQSDTEVFEGFARYIDEQMSKAVLGQTMTADNGSSQSQATVHNEVRHDIAISDARALGGTLARDLVKPFVDLNFGVQDRYPVLSIDVEEPEDTGLIIDKACALMDRGMTFKASELRAKLKLSDPEEGDEIVGGLPAPAEPAPPAPPATNTALNRAGDASAEDTLGEIEDEMLDDWEEVMEEVLSPFAAIVQGAASYEELMAQLAEASPRLGASKLIDALVKGMFIARAAGDAGDAG